MREHASGDRDDCGRAARLLALLDAPARDERDDHDDPAAALPADDCEWLAQHLDACPSCSVADDAAVAPLFAALRAVDRADVPDEASFAAQRRSILATIGVEPPAPPSPVLRLRGRASEQSRPRRALWIATGAALAASLAALLTLPEWRDRDLTLERATVGVPPPATEIASVVGAMDVAQLADAEDAWVVASNALDLDAGDGRGQELGALTDDELDEIEGVFVSVPGWS